MGALGLTKDYLSHLTQNIEQEYDIKVPKLREVDGEKLLVNTKEGKLLVEESESKETHLIFVYGLYEYIKDRKFNNIGEVYTTNSGKHYVGLDGRLFTVSFYIENKESDFPLYKNGYNIIKLLADFHKAAEGYSPPSGGTSKSDWGKWIEKYRKKYRALKKYINKLEGKYTKSPFEQLLLSRCEFYIKRMEQSVNILKKGGYLSIVEESMKKRHVCMCNFKRSNFYEQGSKIYISSLDKCRYDIVEKDIAELLLKLVEYKNNSHTKKFAELIHLYNKENPLGKNSIDIIKAFVLYPEEYEKVCSRHYRGKDKWTEEMYINKLKIAMNYEDRKTELIEAIDGIKLI